jgi:hypothetical protein
MVTPSEDIVASLAHPEALSLQEEELLLKVALHRADPQLAQRVPQLVAHARVHLPFSDVSLQDVCRQYARSKLPAWFTNASWSVRRR